MTRPHALPGFRHESLGKHSAGIVFVNDIVLEVNMALRPADGLQPGPGNSPRVDEQSNAVTADQRRTSRRENAWLAKPRSRRKAGALTVLE